MGRRSFEDVEVGEQLPPLDVPVTRTTLVRYAGASGDFNVIHHSERQAKAVGLPNVIAHGMFTMGATGRIVTDWAGDPASVREFVVRFSRPVVVPDDEVGAVLSVEAVVQELDAQARTALVSITASFGPDKVLTGARALVQLA